MAELEVSHVEDANVQRRTRISPATFTSPIHWPEPKSGRSARRESLLIVGCRGVWPAISLNFLIRVPRMSSSPPAPPPAPVVAPPPAPVVAPPPPEGLSRSYKIAFLITVAAAVVVLVLKSAAIGGMLTDPGHDVVEATFSTQMSSIVGLGSGILIGTQVRDAKWTFVIAALGLLIGAVGTWAWLLVPTKGLMYQLALSIKAQVAPAAFSFGTAFLAKSAEALR